jgi:hypothetical protein
MGYIHMRVLTRTVHMLNNVSQQWALEVFHAQGRLNSSSVWQHVHNSVLT